MLAAAYRKMPVYNFSSHLLQRLPDQVAVMELTGVLWSDWGKPERIADTIRRIGKTPRFPCTASTNPMGRARLHRRSSRCLILGA